MENQKILILLMLNDIVDIKSKYSSNPKDIFKSAKKIMKKSAPSKTSTAATTEFLSKILNRKKISNEHFNLCEAEISLDEITKSINCETNNKSPGNDSLTAEFYKHFSNELTPALLDLYDSWGKLGTMGVTSRTEIISAIYKKDIAKILQTIDPFHF